MPFHFVDHRGRREKRKLLFGWESYLTDETERTSALGKQPLTFDAF